MHKLLELWELDDSALSNHSLQASNSLSVSKHLSLYNEKPVVEPLHHHADILKEDKSATQTKISHGIEMARTQSSTVESPGVLLCEKCKYANEEHANWCIDCGTSLLGTKTKIEPQIDDDLHVADLNGELSMQSLPPLLGGTADRTLVSDIEFSPLSLESDGRSFNEQKSNAQDGNLNDDQFGVVTKSPKWSYTSPVMSKTNPNNRTKKYRNTTASNTTATSQLITSNEYQRHWNTSRAYMWRKPSSIHKSTSSLTSNVRRDDWTQLSRSHTLAILPKDLVPVLDLDAIDEGSLISSIRTSSTINEVWTLCVCVGGRGGGSGCQITLYNWPLAVLVELLHYGHLCDLAHIACPD